MENFFYSINLRSFKNQEKKIVTDKERNYLFVERKFDKGNDLKKQTHRVCEDIEKLSAN